MTGAERVRRHRAKQKKTRPAPAPKRPADLAAWCRRLEVTQGEGEGERLRVLPWQEQYLERVQALAGGEYALSVPAGAGKTTICAAVAAAAVAGPLAKRRGDVVLVAGSFLQACLGFDHALAFLRPWTKDKARWRILRSQNTAMIEDKATGARLVSREASARTLHGAAPNTIVADEPAQWMRTQSDAIYAALRSRLGKLAGSKLLAIGTRPADGAHWFARLLERNGTTYAASPEDDPFEESTWHTANPSLRYFPELLKVYRREAEESRHEPGLLASFRALRLNLGTSDVERNSLIDPALWLQAEGDVSAAGKPVLAVDLGGGAAMSAACAYWPQGGRLESLAHFPEHPNLATRGRADGVGALYERLRQAGELDTTPGRSPSPPALLRAALDRWGVPAAIYADRFREAELRDALGAAGVPMVPLVLRGQGYKDGAEDVRSFRLAVLAGKVRPVKSLLMRHALSGAVTVSDVSGNAKLAKSSEGQRFQRHRDDAAAAAILAVAGGSRMPAPRARPALMGAFV